MKVIKENSNNQWAVGRNFECKNCGSIIQLEKGDSLTQLKPQLFGLLRGGAAFLCPVCKQVKFNYEV